jgi:WD40 repeat protein
LYRLLSEHEYVNILSSRQVGKSSLMVSAALRLQAEGWRFAIVDLTTLGTPLDADTYFRGLVKALAGGLRLRFDSVAFWAECTGETASQRLIRFFRDVVLVQIEAPVSVFLDEVDSTLKLAYTDDLFTSLRAMYNERTLADDYRRLTFCLVGVATPNELIKNRRTTPYNVGRTIWVGDFDPTRDDLSLLTAALHDDPAMAQQMLARVLYWTNGHPFLTLRLVKDLRDEKAAAPEAVDHFVEQTYASLQRLGEDTHIQSILRFTEQRLTDSAATMRLYECILKGKREQDQPTLKHAELKLSGLVKRNAEGCLVGRNRIYLRLFDLTWVRASKALREARRYRAAAAAASLALLLAVGGGSAYYTLALRPEVAQLQTDVAVREMLQRLNVRLGQEEGRLTVEFPNGAPQAVLDQAVPALETLLKEPGGPKALSVDLSDTRIERLAPLAGLSGLQSLDLSGTGVTDLAPLAGLSGLQSLDLSGTGVTNLAPLAGLSGLQSLDLSGTGVTNLAPLAGLSGLRQLEFLGALHDRPVLVVAPEVHTAPIRQLDTDRVGRFLVTASEDKTVRVWAAQDGRLLRTIRLPAGPGDIGKAYAAAISPDGTLVAASEWTRQDHNDVYLFEQASGQLLRRVAGLPSGVVHLAFAPDGTRLSATLSGSAGVRLALSDSAGVRLIDPTAGRVIAVDEAYGGPSYGAAFDPASGRLATTSYDGRLRLYDPALRLIRSAIAPSGHQPHGIAFSPDGSRLAVGYTDSTAVDVLDGATLEPLFAADTAGVNGGDLGGVAWSVDGGSLYAAGRWRVGDDFGLRRWPEGGRGAPVDLGLTRDIVTSLRPLPDGRLAFTTSHPRLELINADGAPEAWKIGPATAEFRDQQDVLAVSADGERVRFGYEVGGPAQAEFSVSGLRLELGGNAEGLSAAQTGAPGLAVENWRNGLEPTLNGRRLALHRYEASRSLAIVPGGERFVLGADWSLRTFSREGRELWERAVPGTVWAVNVSGDGRLLVAAYGDGTIRWHKLDDGTELLALLPLADGERWVLWTPEGYYAASPGAGSLLGWHVNRGRDRAPDFFPITAYGGFYQPNALPLVLRELETPRALGFAALAQSRELVRATVDSLVPPGPQLHVLTVGVSEYANDRRLSLKFADDDARDLANALLGQEGGLYARVKVQHLTNAQVTKRGFFAALRVLLGAMQPGQQDVAVIHFSGHGAMVDGNFYLLPSDVETDSADAIATTGIELRQFKELLLRLGGRGKVLVLLDASLSSGVDAGLSSRVFKGDRAGGLPPDVEQVRAELTAAGTGVIVLTSSSGREVSRESPDWRNGAFTEAVLEALAGRADRDLDSWLSVSELEDYVVRRVRELTHNAQNPRIAALGERHLDLEARLFVTGR